MRNPASYFCPASYRRIIWSWRLHVNIGIRRNPGFPTFLAAASKKPRNNGDLAERLDLFFFLHGSFIEDCKFYRTNDINGMTRTSLGGLECLAAFNTLSTLQWFLYLPLPIFGHTSLRNILQLSSAAQPQNSQDPDVCSQARVETTSCYHCGSIRGTLAFIGIIIEHVQ